MVNLRHQYQCSSQALVYNASIIVKSRPSYLIIDIEPAGTKREKSFSSYDVPFSPSDDASLNKIILVIGSVVVILVVLVIVIKLIHKCYRMCQEDDEVKEPANKSPLLPTSTPVAMRRSSAIRNPSVPMHRSSMNLETQMDIQQKRYSRSYEQTPPTTKKP